jgi:transposase
VSKAGSARADRVRRATALLAVARGRPFAQAAREAGFKSGTTVADLVGRFNRRGLAALRIAPGRGPKATYAPADRAQIVATAQRPPDRRDDGTATWSLATLQRTLRRAALPRVGTSTVRRVLRAAGSSYQKTRTWCPTGMAERKRKDGVVRVVDPETELKRGGSSGPTAGRRRPVSRCGARTRPGRTRRSPSRERVGHRSAAPRGSRTSTSVAAPRSC